MFLHLITLEPRISQPPQFLSFDWENKNAYPFDSERWQTSRLNLPSVILIQAGWNKTLYRGTQIYPPHSVDMTIFFKLLNPTMGFIFLSLSALNVVCIVWKATGSIGWGGVWFGHRRGNASAVALVKLCLPLVYLLSFLIDPTWQPPSAQDESIPAPDVDEAIPPSPLPQSFATSNTEGANCTPGVPRSVYTGFRIVLCCWWLWAGPHVLPCPS